MVASNAVATRSKLPGDSPDPAVDLGRLSPKLPFGVTGLHDHLRRKVPGDEALHAVFDLLTVGVILLDRRGRIIAHNRTASAIAAREDGLGFRCDRPVGASPAETRRLRVVIRAALDASNGDGAGRGRMSLLSRPSGRRALQVLVAPLGLGRAGAVLYVCDPERRPAAGDGGLRQLYGLTSSESRVAELLATGRSLREISAELGIKVQTVRNHLKQIFSKTDTHRQSELVALLLSGPFRLCL